MYSNELEELRNECVLKMVKAISQFQMFERELKGHIEGKYNVIRAILNGKATFNYSKSSLNKKMLGGLVEELSNLTDDEKLIKELKEIVPYRNEIAHERFFIVSESDDINYLKDTLVWLQGIEWQLAQISVRYINDIFKTTFTHIDAFENN
mgnify:CR=1 FL=1